MAVVTRFAIRSGTWYEYGSIRSNNKGDIGHVTLDDYRPIDPSPSSKASLDPGPIEHGTPLNPYIPNPSLPNPPRFGDSD
ncbi:hypothetical protein SESBI_15342 [Sesbania bispinosa]|nr:hypothetical protein SESBI_15342 [Sesbania bispinosa]